MKRTTLAWTILCASLGLAACRGSSGDDAGSPDGPPGGGDGSNPNDTTIYDIQNPSNVVPVGMAVTVRGVVVTAIDTYGNKTGNLWVEEPNGGAYSGVLVYKADVSQVAQLHVGDIVDVTNAQKAEFALSSDTSGRTTTELEPPMGSTISVTKTGTGTVPAPADVDALTIGRMADQASRDAEWEKWEGVLIKVSNVSVTGSVQQIGGTTPDPTFQKFGITGVANVESSLAAFPSGIGAGDCLASVTGVGDYFFDWLIEPTATSDVATGGTACPPPETGATACADGMDNDGNGHTDCADYSCDVEAACIHATTVTAIQQASTPPVGAITLSGSIVTAIATNNKYLWIQDATGAAIYNGVYVYRGSAAAPLSGIVVGSKVDIANAIVSSFTVTGSTDPLTEVATLPGQTMTVTNNPPPGTPAVLSATIANVMGANAEQYEGVLVSLSNVKVFATNLPDDAPTPANKDFSLGDATTSIVVDDFANSTAPATPPAVGTCYSSVTGVIHQRSSNGSIVIEPRSPADLIPGTGC